MKDHARHMVSAAALVALTAAAGCAPGRSVMRGNWPDGRIEGPAMTRPVPVAIAYRAPEMAVETDDWLPTETGYEGMTAAELNRMGVLQPIYFALDEASIDASQIAVLDANIDWLNQVPDAAILIEGHADSRGSRQYNLASANAAPRRRGTTWSRAASTLCGSRWCRTARSCRRIPGIAKLRGRPIAAMSS